MSNKSVIISIEQLLRKQEYLFSYEENGEKGEIRLREDRTYHIPDYQREIRWKASNVKTLISDIKTNDKFLGTILLSTKDNVNYDIIDGQQRITVLLLLIIAINKQLETSPYEFCEFINDTYKMIFEVLDLNFSLQEINTSAKKEEYLQSDILEQRQSFENIWLEIQKHLCDCLPNDLEKLLRNILNCEINVIINSRKADTVSTKICVDYYLDLNDKSVDLDSIDILKAELFRTNFDLMTGKWAKVQKSIKQLHNIGLINYSIPSFFYHYFACSINKQLQYSLNTLKPNLKLNKAISIVRRGGLITFPASTHIVEAVFDRSYFVTSVDNMISVSEFFAQVIQSRAPWQEFIEKYKQKGLDDVTANLAFSIIGAILRNDDEVPKMLLMKYFIDVLNNPSATKKDCNIIYDIYCFSILFSASSKKKSSQQVTRIVMSENWQEKIKEAAYDIRKNSIDKIAYLRAISVNGEVTETSGQYFPKHIIAVKQFFTLNDAIKNVKVTDKGALYKFLSNTKCSAEHFFVNQGYKFEFSYADGKKATISCPAKIKKYISYAANFIYIDSDINKEMGDMTIADKIAFLESKGEEAFSCNMCYLYFLKAKEVFGAGEYPNDIVDTKSKAVAQKKIKEYYKNNFEKEIIKYIEEIKKLAA